MSDGRVWGYDVDMALIDRKEMEAALGRLGELALGEGRKVELVLVGGGAMVLGFGERESTQDLDVVIVLPEEREWIREWVQVVAGERGWAPDWLNDGAKGYVVGDVSGPVIFEAAGVMVRRLSVEQLLAMKLCAWRDDVDVSDARRLLRELVKEVGGDFESVRERVSRFFQAGRELKATYAFQDLWEDLYGDT